MIKLKDILVEKCWKGYEKKGMKKMFGKMYPNCVKKKKKREVKEDRGPCWKGYTQKGMKKKGNKMVPNCVKNEEITEGKKLRLPGGVEATIDFKGIKLQQKGKKPVFLDRNELLNFFRATTKYLRYT